MSLATPRKGYKSVPWLFGKEIEIPQEWELKRIKNIAKVSVGLVINPSTYFDKNGTIPMITGKNVTEKGIVLDNVDLITEKSNELLETTRIWKDDLVTMRVGYPGRTCLVKNEHDGINCASVIITRKNKKYHSQFLQYITNSKLTEQQITKYTAGGAQQVVNISSWNKFLIIFPSLPEQQKIANILSNVDNLIESTVQVIAHSKKVKKGLIQKLLTRGIGHVTFKKVPWLFGKEIEIPEEWEVLPLSEVCSIRETNSVKSNLYIGLEHINQNDNKLVGQSTTEEFTSNTNSFYNDDILYGKLRPLLNKVWLATEEGHCSTDILPLQTKENIVPTILLLILTDYRFFWFAVSYSSGTKMPRTNWSDMKNFLVFLPSVTEQQKIASILSNIDSKIESQEQYKEKLEKLKKSLMQKLLTGEIRVKL